MLSSVNAMQFIIDFEMENKGVFFEKLLVKPVFSCMVWTLCIAKRIEPNTIANGVMGICCICNEAVT